jgi:hypothetical protein
MNMQERAEELGCDDCLRIQVGTSVRNMPYDEAGQGLWE